MYNPEPITDRSRVNLHESSILDPSMSDVVRVMHGYYTVSKNHVWKKT